MDNTEEEESSDNFSPRIPPLFCPPDDMVLLQDGSWWLINHVPNRQWNGPFDHVYLLHSQYIRIYQTIPVVEKVRDKDPTDAVRHSGYSLPCGCIDTRL